MPEITIEERSLDFAVRIVNLTRYLNSHVKEFVVAKQLLRSGTSIGANIAEAQGAQSNADFVAKLHISLKEAKETYYWLKLLHRTQFIREMNINPLNLT